MKRTFKTLSLVLSTCLVLGSANAATIHLKDGRTFEGEIVSNKDGVMVIDSNGLQVSLNTDQVASVDMTGGNAAPATAAPAPTPAPAQAAPAPTPVEVPAGTNITVRLAENISTKTHGSGQRFTARLEANLVANGQVVAPRGSTVYGRITQAKSSGRAMGKSSMTIELTDIMIDNQMMPIVTTALSGEGQSTTGTTVGRTARSAAIGGLIDGSDGAKTGAKVGLGLSLLTSGNDVNVKSGTLMDFQLRAPFRP